MFKRLLNIRSDKGVTLVALIITIIVLLILAGVTINAIVNGDGTIEKASEAKNATENSNNKAILEDLVARAMGNEKETTLHLDTLTNAVGNVGTVAAEGRNFTVTIQGYKYWVTDEGEVSFEKPIKIGDEVNYTTTLNEVTLDNWKVFYADGNYVYLILDDYLPNSAVSNTVKTTYNLANGYGNYCITSTTNKKDLIDAMTTSSNWDSLLTGTLNGKSIDYRSSTDTNVRAWGSPTLDLYVNSWNAKYPSNKMYIAKKTDMNDSVGWGYYVGSSENPKGIIMNVSNTSGYSDPLYYPHKTTYESCGGYWLASPSAFSNTGVMLIYCGGIVNAYDYNNSGLSIRPVVCLPASTLQ